MTSNLATCTFSPWFTRRPTTPSVPTSDRESDVTASPFTKNVTVSVPMSTAKTFLAVSALPSHDTMPSWAVHGRMSSVRLPARRLTRNWPPLRIRKYV